MKRISLLISTLLFSAVLFADESPYAGEENRSIKSLSAEEIEALEFGRGMGFAMLAELNHYPGPKHVLELAHDLELTPSQLTTTKALFAEMQRNAISLGNSLLQAEKDLDREFESGTIDAESLNLALANIGSIRTQLRYVHLEAHLRQRPVLTTKQLVKYDNLRGYRDAEQDHNQRSSHHN